MKKVTLQETSCKAELCAIVQSVYAAKRCLIITGAGISVSSGIPDFRSSDGLYNLVKTRFDNKQIKGKDLFDAALFRDSESTSIFYTFMGELKATTDEAKPTVAHNFIKHLDERGRLMRCYTQNIDGLEARVNLTIDVYEKPKVVQLHGNLAQVVCTLCRKRFEFSQSHIDVYRKGECLPCPRCEDIATTRVAAGRRPLTIGTLRPNIVLYNEFHCFGEIIAKITAADLRNRPDVLIVMGTSLKVRGIKKLVKDAAASVRKTASKLKNTAGLCLLINRTELAMSEWGDIFDYHLEADSDDASRYIMDQIKQRDDLRLAKAKLREEAKAIVKKKAALSVPTIITFNSKKKSSLPTKEKKTIPIDDEEKENDGILNFRAQKVKVKAV